MSYRVIKTIKGRQYIYEQSTFRVAGIVKTKSTYVGPLDPLNSTAHSDELHSTQLSHSDILRCLNTSIFQDFVNAPVSGRYPVALAPKHFQTELPHTRREIFLSAETQRKILKKHPEITIDDFVKLQDRLEKASIYPDDKYERHRILLAYEDGWWRLVIKSTGKGELYLQTYHRSNSRQMKKIKGRN